MSTPDTPKTGYELAAKILATHPDAIETMLRCSHGTESDWLEFKAGMTLLPEDEKKGLKPDDLYWNCAKSIVAMINTSGGAFVIGVDNKHNPVPLSQCDPRHVIEKEDVDAYIRKEILDRIAPDGPKPQSWTDCKGVTWSIEERLSPFVESRQVVFHDETIVVLLVKPSEMGKELLVLRKEKGSESDQLPFRKPGDVGGVEILSRYAVIKKYPEIRQRDSDRFANLFGQTAPALFICHSSKDCKAADQIRQRLEAKGITCWFAPKNINGGNQWADSIVDAIGSSTAFLCLISRNSQKSRNVDSEVRLAFTRNKKIIPVRIDRTPLSKSMEYYLAQFQIIEAVGREVDAIKDMVKAIALGEADEEKPPTDIPPPPPPPPQPPTLPPLPPLVKLGKIVERFRESTVRNTEGIAPISILTDKSPIWRRCFLWTSGGYFFWEKIAEENGWKLQRNKFSRHFRIRDPEKVCRAYGSIHHIRRLLFPELWTKPIGPRTSHIIPSAIALFIVVAVVIFFAPSIRKVLTGVNVGPHGPTGGITGGSTSGTPDPVPPIDEPPEWDKYQTKVEKNFMDYCDDISRLSKEFENGLSMKGPRNFTVARKSIPVTGEKLTQEVVNNLVESAARDMVNGNNNNGFLSKYIEDHIVGESLAYSCRSAIDEFLKDGQVYEGELRAAFDAFQKRLPIYQRIYVRSLRGRMENLEKMTAPDATTFSSNLFSGAEKRVDRMSEAVTRLVLKFGSKEIEEMNKRLEAHNKNPGTVRFQPEKVDVAKLHKKLVPEVEKELGDIVEQVQKDAIDAARKAAKKARKDYEDAGEALRKAALKKPAE